MAPRENSSALPFLARKDGPERGQGMPGRRGLFKRGSFWSLALRLISLLLVMACLLLLGIDLLTSLEQQGTIRVRAVSEIWAALNPGQMAQFLGWAGSNKLDHAARTLLALPGWAFCGVSGVILAFVAGRRP